VDIVFLDANVLFSAAYRLDAKFLELWRIPNVHLRSSAYDRVIDGVLILSPAAYFNARLRISRDIPVEGIIIGWSGYLRRNRSSAQAGAEVRGRDHRAGERVHSQL
jgi:hypothetical protein